MGTTTTPTIANHHGLVRMSTTIQNVTKTLERNLDYASFFFFHGL